MSSKCGDTPLIEVNGIYAKLECANPTGSIKDRIAKYIIDKSEEQEKLRPGMSIIEATSGNTGIAMSYYGAIRGYDVKIIMPKNMSEERKTLIKGMGAQLFTCSEGNFKEAAQIRDMISELPGYFNPDQFSNPLNVECHEKTTGQEILSQISESEEKIDAFVAGVGTGGTIIGIGKALRKVFPNIHIVAVEPTESPVMSGGSPGLHGIQGIGDGFIPPIASDGQGGVHKMIDEILCFSTQEAKSAALEIQEKFGHCVGISSGANYLAAMELKERFKTVVTVFADGYSKYQSEGLKYCGRDRCEYEDPERRVFAFYKK